MLQVCCWDLAVLICTQALRIDWRSPSGSILSLDCISTFWRIFPNNFLFDLPNAPLVLLFFFHITAYSLLLTVKGLWELPPSSAWMGTFLTAMAKPLHPWKHIAEHHRTRSALFLKPLFSWGLKKPAQPDFWENWEDLCNPGLQDRLEKGAQNHQQYQRQLHYPTLRSAHPSKLPPKSPPWIPRGQQQLVGSSWGCCSTRIFQHTKCSLGLPNPGFLHRASKDVLR